MSWPGRRIWATGGDLGDQRRLPPDLLPRQLPTRHRAVVSSQVFADLDAYVWQLTYKWARHTHPNKPRRWVVARYFGKFNRSRQDRWVYGDRDSGAYLVKFAWTPIVRHTLVKGWASPDDPALADYWARRRQRSNPALDGVVLRLLARQDGCCPLCGERLFAVSRPPQSPSQWERWWQQVTRQAILADGAACQGRSGSSDGVRSRLVHAACQREQRVRQRSSPASGS